MAWTLAMPVAAQTPAQEAPLTLEAAIERALTANPGIVAARLRRVASMREVDVSRERLNPEARVEFEREAPTHAYSLAVPIETGGKRTRRIAASEAPPPTGMRKSISTGSMRVCRLPLPEHHHVLPWEPRGGALPYEGVLGGFTANLRFGHLVQRLDGHAGVLRAVFHEDHTA